VLETGEDGKKNINFDFSQNEAEVIDGVVCPMCGGAIQVKSFGFGCANYDPQNAASCRFAIGSLAGKELNVNQVRQLLLEGRTETIRGFKSKTGKKFDACVALDKAEDGRIVMKFDFDHVEAKKVKDVVCPICGGDIVQTPFGFGCANYSKDNPESCKFSIGKIAGVTLKEAQVKELLLRGRTDVIQGFVAKTGMKFDAPLKLTAEGQVAFDFPERPKPIETAVKCPKCEKLLKKSEWYYECECGFKVSHTVAKVSLSEEIMEELLTTGKTRKKVAGFVSRAGNQFDTCLKFEDDRIQFDFDNPGEETETSAQTVEQVKEENSYMQPEEYHAASEPEEYHTASEPEDYYAALAEDFAAQEAEVEAEAAAGMNFLDEFANEHDNRRSE
jgi:DNA topoisomerase-3